MLLRIITLFIVSCGLTGCVNLTPSKDTTKMYVLGPVDLPSSGSATGAELGYIARPYLPVYMEGTGLKVRAMDGEISNLPSARWAEPMDIGVARALSHYIELASGGVRSGFYPWPKSEAATNTLHVKFHQLVATADGRIQLSASWELTRAAGVSQSGVFTLADGTWSPGDAQNMVAGVNAALEALAEQIFSSLKKR